jgi:hypothetical protein
MGVRKLAEYPGDTTKNIENQQKLRDLAKT